MAGRARSTDVAVIKTHPTPTRSTVTTVASRRGDDVIRRFTCRHSAVVTRCATAGHFGVIDSCHRTPTAGCMTRFTTVAAVDMRTVFTDGRNPVVTAGTIIGHATVIEGAGIPATGFMAILTIVTTGDVIGAFAHCNHPVMAAKTVAQHIVVIDPFNRCPTSWGMTRLATVAGAGMSLVLALRVDSVVTTEAVASHFGVINTARRPAVGGMTITTVVAAGDVVGFFTFGNHAVMASGARAVDLAVIHLGDIAPTAWHMARFTDVAAGDVAIVFALRLRAVVTTAAIGADTAVIKLARRPIDGVVTGLAVVARSDVVDLFTHRNAAIVASKTTAHHRRVIHLTHLPPTVGGVTTFAAVATADVIHRFTAGHHAVVTTAAIVHHPAVIKVSGRPTAGSVTTVTRLIGGNVTAFLAPCGGAVMTTAARADHLVVIDGFGR